MDRVVLPAAVFLLATLFVAYFLARPPDSPPVELPAERAEAPPTHELPLPEGPPLPHPDDGERVARTRVLLDRLAVALREWEGLYGDFPPSSPAELAGFRRGAKLPFELYVFPANPLNAGNEVMQAALSAEMLPPKPPVYGLNDLANTDADLLRLTGAVEPIKAFELIDAWGNPLVYIHRRDYGRTVEVTDQRGFTHEVQARKSESGKYYALRSYQLFSSGPDAKPGTEDDITNW